MKRLLSDGDLERSSVVANCRMNRERELTGSNGYDRELGFDPLDFLSARVVPGRVVRWLDLCCGMARALIQAADRLEHAGLAETIAITGVDLVEMFWSARPASSVRLVVSSVHDFAPAERFELITCVHGLHYLGDKLTVIERALSWLAEDGLFAANLHLVNLRQEDGKPIARMISKLFREVGIEHDGAQEAYRLLGTERSELSAEVPWRGRSSRTELHRTSGGGFVLPELLNHHSEESAGLSREAVVSLCQRSRSVEGNED